MWSQQQSTHPRSNSPTRCNFLFAFDVFEVQSHLCGNLYLNLLTACADALFSSTPIGSRAKISFVTAFRNCNTVNKSDLFQWVIYRNLTNYSDNHYFFGRVKAESDVENELLSFFFIGYCNHNHVYTIMTLNYDTNHYIQKTALSQKFLC